LPSESRAAAQRALIVRGALAPLAVVNAGVGLLAAFAPRRFFDDFPFVASWVDQLPPYNEHLTTDVGAFYLGFGVLFAWAAVTLERTLVTALCVVWSVAATLHLFFHLRNLDALETGAAVGQTLALVGALVPAVLVLLLGRSGRFTNGGS